MSLQATLRNAPDYPAVGEIAVYDAPASGKEKFKIANGAGGYAVTNITEDPNGESFNKQTYLWFEVEFPGKLKGWVRDEYVVLSGDGSAYGLGKLDVPMGAFTLVHGSANLPTEINPPTPEPSAEPTSVASPLERVLRVALDITATFEGGYSSYQANPNDKGIISYGRFQFTLAHGALYKVVKLYVDTAQTSAVASQLRGNYLSRIAAKDATLQGDDTLKTLLREAAREIEMQNAQNLIAKEKYWDVILELSAKPRGIVKPLSLALMMDMGINHGIYHDYFTETEKALGVPERSAMPANGATEEVYFQRVAKLRQERMYTLADRYGWGGLKVRADFWVNLIAKGDWNLDGTNGVIEPKAGRTVNTR